MTTGEYWRSLFENWPETIPREGLLVTTFNETIPFNGFLLSGGVLLVDRDKPDTFGARKVMIAYSAIQAVKLTSVLELGRFQVMGFLVVFSALLYFTKKRVWQAVLHDPELEKPRASTQYKV